MTAAAASTDIHKAASSAATTSTGRTNRWRSQDKTDTSLYGSEHIKPDTKIVLAVEGEQDVDAARSIGLVAVSSAMGAGKAAKFDWSCCYGHPVMVVADKELAGRTRPGRVTP